MDDRRHDSGRREAPRRGVAVPLGLAAVFLAGAIAVALWSTVSAPPLGDLEHEETSAFSRIRVRRAGDVRTLSFVRDDGREAVQSRVSLSAPHTLLSPYARAMFASYLYQPAPRRILIVGLGGGAMVRFLTHHDPDVEIDAVEIDPAVVRLAGEYFGVRDGGNVRIHTADAVAFIASTEDRYDAVFMDAFLRPSGDTDATGVPSRLKTLAFLERLRQVLTPGGVAAFNLNEHAHTAEDVAAIAAVFPHAAVFRCPPATNRVVVATAAGAMAETDLHARIAALDARFGGALSFGEILGNRE